MLYFFSPAGPGVHHDVADYLPSIARRLSAGGEPSNMYLVHRLDRDVTGAMLIARFVVQSL